MLQGCHSDKMTFTIAFPDANGLEIGDALYLKGVKIGEVTQIDIEGVLVVVNVIVESKYYLPTDSFFFIWTEKGHSNKMCIQIKDGMNETLIKNGDLLKGESSYSKILIKCGMAWLKSL